MRVIDVAVFAVVPSGDKERMRTMITWLGFRHVKYGVRPHHIPIMGQVALIVLFLAIPVYSSISFVDKCNKIYCIGYCKNLVNCSDLHKQN